MLSKRRPGKRTAMRVGGHRWFRGSQSAKLRAASAKAGNGSVSRATIGCPGLEQLAAPTRKCGQLYFSVSFAAPPRSCDFREAAYTVATGAVLSISAPVGAVKRYTVSNAKSA